MKELTKREMEIYDYIVKFKTVNGFSPTITEMSKVFYCNRNNIRIIIYRLVDKGYITYNPEKMRSIVVTKMLS